MQLRKTIYIAGALLMAGFYGCQPATAAPREKIPARIQRALQITSPASGARVQSPVVVKGAAAEKGTIMVNVKATFTGGEQDLGTFSANPGKNNQWQTTPINLWAPENSRDLRYVITAAQKTRRNTNTSSVTVLPPQKVVMVPRDQLTPQRFEKLNPGVILPPRNTVPKPGPIDPITGRPRNTGGSTSADTATRITSPNRNNSTIQLPLLIEGSGEKNSKFRIEILTRHKKYGQESATGKIAYADSDNTGKWSVGRFSSLEVDEADGKVTHEINATRIEGNTKKGTLQKSPYSLSLKPPHP